MSKRKGRKWERKAIARLEELGWTVKDVSPNAGTYSDDECDLLISYGDGPELRCEVKYRKGATGFGKLYTAHLETIGLGTTDFLFWPDEYAPGYGWRTGGLLGLTQDIKDGRGPVSYEHDDTLLNKTLDGWLNPDDMPPRDVLLLRASSRKVGTPKWCAIWRSK